MSDILLPKQLHTNKENLLAADIPETVDDRESAYVADDVDEGSLALTDGQTEFGLVYDQFVCVKSSTCRALSNRGVRRTETLTFSGAQIIYVTGNSG